MTINQNLVSIVLTVLNGATYLEQCLEGCLNQTYPNIELIVVDGGSTDGTLEILVQHSDPRMIVIHQQGNIGKLPGAINLGLENARGEYLTWMQADCLYSLDAIEMMVDCLEKHPEVGQVYTDFWEINEQGEKIRLVQTREPDTFLHNLGDPAGVCFLIRRSVRESVGEHHIWAYPSQDYDYRMRIALLFMSFHLKEPLYSWRVQSQSLTSQIGWKSLAYKDIQIRLRLGLDDRNQARKRKAEIELADSFEHYQHGVYRGVPGRILKSGFFDPIPVIGNRGVWSILFKSLYRASFNTWKR